MKEQLLNKVENIAANGGIAHYEQFLLLPQCFLKLYAAEALIYRQFSFVCLDVFNVVLSDF